MIVAPAKKLLKSFLSTFGLAMVRIPPACKSSAVENELARLQSLPPCTETITTILGHELVIPCPHTFISLYSEIWEREIYRLPDSLKNVRVIDCGANIGMASIYIKRQYPDAEIVAIEADKGIADLLKRNVKSAGCPDVTVINAAVSDSEGECLFESDPGGTAGRLSDTGTPVQYPTLVKIRVDSWFPRPFFVSFVPFCSRILGAPTGRYSKSTIVRSVRRKTNAPLTSITKTIPTGIAMYRCGP